jgi:hypothetical protein
MLLLDLTFRESHPPFVQRSLTLTIPLFLVPTKPAAGHIGHFCDQVGELSNHRDLLFAVQARSLSKLAMSSRVSVQARGESFQVASYPAAAK